MADDAAAPEVTEPDQTADTTAASESDARDASESPESSGSSESQAEPEPAGPAKRGFSYVHAALIIGVVLVLALGGLAGYLGYGAYHAYQADQDRKLFLQVGRQGALNLTTINHETAEADVQRVLDSATGTFYDDFSNRADPFIAVVKQAQSKSEGTVTEAGVESVSETGDEAKVIVAVTVRTSNAGAPEQQPRAWRMKLTVQKDGDDSAKISNVEFVP